MRTLCLIWIACLCCACNPRAVRCDGRLEPINAPAVRAGHGPHAP
jgi:hypothetical protein